MGVEEVLGVLVLGVVLGVVPKCPGKGELSKSSSSLSAALGDSDTPATLGVSALWLGRPRWLGGSGSSSSSPSASSKNAAISAASYRKHTRANTR